MTDIGALLASGFAFTRPKRTGAIRIYRDIGDLA